MILWLLLFHTLFGWSKEIRSLPFTESEIKVCGDHVSWSSLMPELSQTESECLDSNEPLNMNNLLTDNQDVSKVIASPTVFSVKREQLVKILKSVKLMCLEHAELKIPSQIQMNFVSKLSTEFFQIWLESELKKNYPNKNTKITQVTVPKIECGSSHLVQWGSFTIESKSTFRFLMVVDEKKLGVSGEFRLYQKIPIAKRNINALEKIAETDFEIQDKDVTFSPGYVSKIEEMSGKTLLSPVSQGSPVELKALKQEYQVEKGQIVQIQFQGPNFLVSATALAEQNGILGEFIKIKNTETQKILSGVVTGKGLVEVK